VGISLGSSTNSAFGFGDDILVLRIVCRTHLSSDARQGLWVKAIVMHTVLNDLYDVKSSRTLYHYTSIDGLQGIVESRSIWATEIRYLSDAKEVFQSLDILLSVIRAEYESSDATKREFLRQFEVWLRDRLVNGHLVFVASLSEQGNLLSQWRAYSPIGKGVSLGFDPQYIRKIAQQQGYNLGKCVYDRQLQQRVIQEIFRQIEEEAASNGPENDIGKCHPSNSYYGIFEKFEDDLLMCAALLKHPAFSEEREWRVVSSVVKRYAPSDIQYREGRSCLVPYRKLSLFQKEADQMKLKEVFVGPTPNSELSMRSVGLYLSNRGISPMVANSLIPYRVI